MPNAPHCVGGMYRCVLQGTDAARAAGEGRTLITSCSSSPRLQRESAVANRARLLTQSLITEATEYARRSPALDGILRQHGPLMVDMGLTKITNSTATKPATR